MGFDSLPFDDILWFSLIRDARLIAFHAGKQFMRDLIIQVC